MTQDHRIFDAIIKGIVEHDDSTFYFGSLGAHRYHLLNAHKYGLLEDRLDQVTPSGKEWYAQRGLSRLPEVRWMFWGDSNGESNSD